MQAMRPVFSDLLQDLQRSIGYYQSVHRDRKLTEMVGIGSTFKIPGLRKFIGQQLQIEVGRLDEFRRISVAGRDSAAFSEHVVNFATAYGLALQGVGLAPIDVNLVPTTQLREQVWHSKSKWFVAAAAVFVAGAATSLYHPLKDSASLPRGDLPEVVQAISAGEQYRNDLQAEQASATGANAARNMVGLLDERRIWPFILNDVASALRASDPQPVLLGADVPAILGIAPEDRRLVELTNFSADYAYAGDPVRTRRLSVVLHVELTHKDPVEFLNSTVAQWLRDHADPSGERADVPYRIVAGSVSCNPTSRLTEIVGEDGRSTTAPSESGSGNRSAPPPKAPPSAPAPPRPAPGAGAGGNSGGGGPGGFGFGGGGNEMGRRQTSGTRRAAPGSDLSGGTGFGTGSSGGGDSPSGGGEIPAPPAGGDPFSGTGDGGRESDLNRLAPISEPAPVLPAGAVIYRLPITFDIEIIERVVIPPPQADARGIPSLLEGLA